MMHLHKKFKINRWLNSGRRWKNLKELLVNWEERIYSNKTGYPRFRNSCNHKLLIHHKFISLRLRSWNQNCSQSVKHSNYSFRRYRRCNPPSKANLIVTSAEALNMLRLGPLTIWVQNLKNPTHLLLSKEEITVNREEFQRKKPNGPVVTV